MRAQRTVSGVVLTALTATILALGASGASASSSQESQFVSKINAERRERGKGTLTVKSDLVEVARRHSARMAKEGRIWHNPNLAKEVRGNWTTLGENVGMGPSVDSLHRAFMNSKGHRDNILLSAFNQVGVGIVVDNGTIYVTEIFARRDPPKSTSSTSTKPASTTSSPAPAKVAAQAPAPTPVSAPAAPKKQAPKPKPKPAKEKPQTVDLLVRVVGLDADHVDPATGAALGF